MDAVSSLETALGAELLRADMLGAERPRIGGRYVVHAFLGRGATGLVVAAQDQTLARKVALKLSPVGADDSIAEEARALARLDHPNVVRVFDAAALDIELAGQAFRVWAVSMQLVEGATLRSWLREQKRTPREIVRVMREAGAGLAAAHAQRIVHRDFKPDNVLVRADGVAQVIDFGFAVAHRSSVGLPVEQIAGTAPYLAPEARQGFATPRSDQFSFGITLVEALTGDPTAPGHDLPEGVAPELWKVARRATDPDAKDRFADMGALLEELRVAQHAPRRSSRSVRVGLSILVLLVIGSLWFNYRTRRCGEIAGDWQLDTLVEDVTSGRMATGTTGRYHLRLRHDHACTFDVELALVEDRRPGQRPHAYTPPVVRVSGHFSGGAMPLGPVELSLAEGSRGYDLVFPSADVGNGVFHARDFSGRVTSMSRFDPLAGHDPRRTE